MSKKFPSWNQQIKSPQWQKKRLEVLNLRGFKCEKCGSEEKTLHVHHRFYINGRLIHEYDNDVLQVLCKDCHAKEHDDNSENIKIKYLIKSIDDFIHHYRTDDSIIDDICFCINESKRNPEHENVFGNLANCFNSTAIDKIIFDMELIQRMDYIETKLVEND